MTYKRKEVIGDCTLYLGDCLEVMATLDAVDHIISDPPYEQVSQDRIGGIKRNDGGKVTEKLSFAGIDGMRDAVCGATSRLSLGWGLFFCTAEGVALWGLPWLTKISFPAGTAAEKQSGTRAASVAYTPTLPISETVTAGTLQKSLYLLCASFCRTSPTQGRSSSIRSWARAPQALPALKWAENSSV